MTTIMLAEDDPGMLYLLKTLLKLEGLSVTELDPEEKDILSAIRRANPDVLLLDVHLTQGNGMDVLREMRASTDLKNMVVIMASGMSLHPEAMAAGANAFLLKPYMPEDLINAIHDHTQKG
jgi:CheY-like chemotaxis protein